MDAPKTDGSESDGSETDGPEPMDLNRLKIDRSETARGRAPAASERRRRSPWLRRGIIAVLGLFLLWLFRGPLLGLYDRLTLPEVQVVVAVKTNPLQSAALSGVSANGYVIAARRAALSADTPGRIVEMNVEEGSVVASGDVVARLYSKEYAAALRRAAADLKVAQSGAVRAKADKKVAEAAAARAQADVGASEQAKAAAEADVPAAQERVTDATAAFDRAAVDLDRVADLKKSGAETLQAVDDARTRRDRAKAILNAARAAESNAEARVLEAVARVTSVKSSVTEAIARVAAAAAAILEADARVEVATATRDEAQAILEKTEVKAPFDGVIVLKDAEVGEVVSPNSQGGSSRGSVVTMVDFKSLEVQVDLPETSLAGIDEKTRADIFLDAYPADRYAGIVRRLWPTANRQKGTVEIRVRFRRPDKRLRPEMGARVVFRTAGTDGDVSGGAESGSGSEASVVLVPRSAVVRQDGRSGVFLIERDRVRFVTLVLGKRQGSRVVVKDGLEGGERLVDQPPARLDDGARIRTPE